MRRFFKVEMAVDGWGLLVNEGTAEPKFRVIMKGTEHYMERLAAELNSSRRATSDGDTGKCLRERRRD